MAENTKYDVVLNEISSMEAQVVVLTNKCRETAKRNRELEEQASKFKKENFELLQKISSLEADLEKLRAQKEVNSGGSNLEFNSLNPKERENLKVRLQNLISRIDYHLSADRQV